jgi:hypothetical protein
LFTIFTTKNFMRVHIKFGLMALIVAAVSACGGGGADTSSNANANANAPVLSDTQKQFEEVALTANGGAYNVSINWGLSAAGAQVGAPVVTPTWTVNFTGANASKSELSKSPLGESAGILSTYTPSFDLIATLPTPANRSDSDVNNGTAVIDNGQIRFYSAKTPSRYTYVGDDIVAKTATLTGEVVSTVRIIGYAKVALNGKFSDAPQEIRDIYTPAASYISSTATFSPGAAYYKLTVARMGDHLLVSDSDRNPLTDPMLATPAYTGTIEQFAATLNSPLYLPNGTIKSVKGARCWVNNTANVTDQEIPRPVFPGASQEFGSYCEVAGKVYLARFQPDGAQLGTNYPSANLVSVNAPVLRVPFQVRYNKAAMDSILDIVN